MRETCQACGNEFWPADNGETLCCVCQAYRDAPGSHNANAEQWENWIKIESDNAVPELRTGIIG